MRPGRPTVRQVSPKHGSHWSSGMGRTPLVAQPILTFQIPHYHVAGARLLLVIGLSALLPGLWFLLFIRRRRRAKQAGHCPTCGYDLRASPEHCPECGMIREKVAEAEKA